MKGCLKRVFVISAVLLLSIAAIAGILYGGYSYLKKEMQSQFNPAEVTDRAEKFIDLSGLPAEYAVTKAINLAGMKVVAAEYSPNEQTAAVVDPGWVIKVSKQNILDGSLEKQARKYLSKMENEKFRIGKFDIKEKGLIHAFGQAVPYLEAKISISTEENQDKHMKGIISVVKNPVTHNNNLIISFNDAEKYSYSAAEDFFKNVRFQKKSPDSGKE